VHSSLIATPVTDHVASLALHAATLLALLLAADYLIERRPFFGRPFWALVDSGVHGWWRFSLPHRSSVVPKARRSYWLWPSWRGRSSIWIAFSLPGLVASGRRLTSRSDHRRTV
jgi:hypothetical protein